MERKINKVPVDLTEYPTEVVAQILRQLCEVEVHSQQDLSRPRSCSSSLFLHVAVIRQSCVLLACM